MQSTSSPQAALDLMEEEELGKFARRQGNLSQLQLLNSILDQQKATASTAQVRRAIDEAAIRTAGGKVTNAEEEMQTIVFGDVTNQAPPVPPSQSGSSSLLRAGLMAAALLGGPVGLAVGFGLPLLLDKLKPAVPAPAIPGKSTTIERDYEVGPVVVEPPGLFDLQEP